MTTARELYMKESIWDPGRKVDKNIPYEYLQLDPNAKIVDLTDPDLLPEINVNFLEMIELRSTERIFNQDENLTLKELSYLLWCTQGIKMVMNNKVYRNNPSAGGRGSIETFLYIRKVEGLEEGLYLFLPFEHKLALISNEENLSDEITKCFSTTKVVKESAVLFLWATLYNRVANVFGERSYRYVHLDAGHICQNLYFAAQTMKIKTCPLGAFKDDEINKILKLDGNNQFLVYGAGVGK